MAALTLSDTYHHLPADQAAAVALPDDLEVGGVAHPPADLSVGGVHRPGPDLAIHGVAHPPADLSVGGVHRPGNLSLAGRARLAPPERKLDWALALLVWIGTWGQEYFQNETYLKTGQAHAVWLGEVRRDRKLAWAEFELAWAGGPRAIDDDERDHAAAFRALLQKMCNFSRLKNIPRGKGDKDVDPPLWDRLVRYYTEKQYGPRILDNTPGAISFAPLIV